MRKKLANPNAKNRVKVDLVQLEGLRRSFPTVKEFTSTIGRSDSWYSDVTITGTMHITDALAIKALHGVDVIITEPEPEVEEQPTEQTADAEIIKRLDALIEAQANQAKMLADIGIILLELKDAVNKPKPKPQAYIVDKKPLNC